ncbi:putative protein kinase [Tieghemostelium lacteum]|uniref:non-specific serine/threonine protein kinase n=1 Tax=Tieghemostelium lacteum TaxID=361077 RepID=A0A151ZHG9_TIELA|nr:putative protein kinase [Tieghemostelium lacteum]|eukprot:KYQ93367.1 putative protein kinase [Tieghemostelium lacteum]
MNPNNQQLTLYHDNLEVILHNEDLEKLVLYDPQHRDIIVKESNQEFISKNYKSLTDSYTGVPSYPYNNEPNQASNILSITNQQKHQQQYCSLCLRKFETSINNTDDIIDEDDDQSNNNNHHQPYTSNRRLSTSYISNNYFLLLDESTKKSTTPNQIPTNTNANVNSSDPFSNEYLNIGYYKKFFVESLKIGSGGFGAVFLCKHLINGIDLGEFAIKKVPIGENLPWLYRVLKEVKALETLQKHVNIINYKHSWLEYDQPADFGPKVPCLYILMEYANAGNLSDYIASRGGILTDNEIWSFFIDLCHGIGYLHHSNIVHKDLKPQNILLHQSYDSISDRQVTHLMISDFGTCDTVINGVSSGVTKRTGNTGTMEYIAPELLKKNEKGELYAEYNQKCDIWSLGVLLYQMTFGTLPYRYSGNPMVENDPNRNIAFLIDEISQFQDSTFVFPNQPHRSKELKEIISVLLRSDPHKRPSISQILSNQFIQSKTKQFTINPIQIHIKSKKSTASATTSQSDTTASSVKKRRSSLIRRSKEDVLEQEVKVEVEIDDVIYDQDITNNNNNNNTNNNNGNSTLSTIQQSQRHIHHSTTTTSTTRMNGYRALLPPPSHPKTLWQQTKIQCYQLWKSHFLLKLLYCLLTMVQVLICRSVPLLLYPTLFYSLVPLLMIDDISTENPNNKRSLVYLIHFIRFSWFMIIGYLHDTTSLDMIINTIIFLTSCLILLFHNK